jgi:hypothetical protein
MNMIEDVHDRIVLAGAHSPIGTRTGEPSQHAPESVPAVAYEASDASAPADDPDASTEEMT